MQTEEHFAIKHPNAWLWKGKLTREEVLARVEEDRLGREWLICPFGSANYAVPVGLFMDDPATFLRLRQHDAEKELRRQSIVSSVNEPILLKAGQYLLLLFIHCLLAGGAIVKLFFPDMVGAGLTPTALMILIPIWSIGGVGLLAFLLGWFQYKYRVRVTLKREMERTADRIDEQRWGSNNGP